MSAQYLNAITENASRLGMRIQESFLENTRDLNLNRGSGAAYLDSADDKTKDIRKQLDSSNDREKLDAMKRLIALISKGRQVSEYFAQVVKNVASSNLEIRKLVYIYLLRYAEQEPDLVLLSINTFQRDLSDANPLIRAMALRVLSGIKVPVIGSIVVLAIKRCAADTSPYVRKTASLAIPKCYELDANHLPALIDIISTLLGDRSPLSLGSVAVAFETVCPTRLDLLHPHYRRLCRVLVDLDEWGQISTMNLLLRYVRTMLRQPSTDIETGTEDLDSDVKLLLTSTEPVLLSRNPAVVMTAAKVIYYVAPPSFLSKIVQPLLRLLNASKEVERVVLAYLLVITRNVPQLLASSYTRFLLRADDLQRVKKDKIKLLLNILSLDNCATLIREFVDYTDDVDDEVVTESIQAIGTCAKLVPESTKQVLSALVIMIESPYDVVVSNAVLVLKQLLQAQLSRGSTSMVLVPQAPLAIVAQVARKLDHIKNAQARACVIWLVGQYAASQNSGPGPDGIAEWAPDVLRKMAKTFGTEAHLVKLQIVTLAAKLYVLCPTHRTIDLLSRYVFSLARYDLSYDVRDRARMMTSLLVGVGSLGDNDTERQRVVLRREQVRLVLFDGKVGSLVNDQSHLSDPSMLGSLSVTTGRPRRMDNILPDWLEKGVESSLRDSTDDLRPVVPVATAISSSTQRTGQSGPMAPVVLTPTGQTHSGSTNEVAGDKGSWRDLDKFYGDTQEEDEDSVDESEDGESDEEESDEERREESTEQGSNKSNVDEESSTGDDDRLPEVSGDGRDTATESGVGSQQGPDDSFGSSPWTS